MQSFNAIGRRKPLYPVGAGLARYLEGSGRQVTAPVAYAELLRHEGLMPHRDSEGRETLWSAVLFGRSDQEELFPRLVEAYQLLVGGGGLIGHLQVAGIDLCPYGNSQPFRVKIINRLNENHDYYYIKRTDASRVFGLELEHLLSPYRMNFQVDGDTLLEEHVIGVPGDAFIARPERYGGELSAVRLCKEFVKFNERCFVRLLGDMRAYNFVVDVIHDLDHVQYRLRAIDLDQQCYEGRLRIYLPQFYKENLPYVQLAQRVIGPEPAQQYREEERALMGRRMRLSQHAVDRLLEAMATDVIAPPDHVRQLAEELAAHHRDDRFRACPSMGELLRLQLTTCLPE